VLGGQGPDLTQQEIDNIPFFGSFLYLVQGMALYEQQSDDVKKAIDRMNAAIPNANNQKKVGSINNLGGLILDSIGLGEHVLCVIPTGIIAPMMNQGYGLTKEMGSPLLWNIPCNQSLQVFAKTTNTALYLYDTVMSYMNMFHPTLGTPAAYNTGVWPAGAGYSAKIIITVPGSAWQDTTAAVPNPWYGLMQDGVKDTFIKELTGNSPNVLSPSLSGTAYDPQALEISNYSTTSAMVIILDPWDGCPACSSTVGELPGEICLDVTTIATFGMGAPFEYWLTKKGLYGYLQQILTKTATKPLDEFWLISLSWGTSDICYTLNREKSVYGLDVPQAETCEGLGYNEGQYVLACEVLLKELTEDHKCIFFVASGDCGCVSRKKKSDGSVDPDSCYSVDYPTCSQYVVSVGGIDYYEKAESPRNNTSWKNLANEIAKKDAAVKSSGFAKTLTTTPATAPLFTIGGLQTIDNYNAITGSGFHEWTTFLSTDPAASFLEKWYADSAIGKPTTPWKITKNDASLVDSTKWNTLNPPRGTPDIAAIMHNGAGVYDSQQVASPSWATNLGTSFSAPVMAAFFSVVLSNASAAQIGQLASNNNSMRQILYNVASNTSATNSPFWKPSQAGNNDIDFTPASGVPVLCKGFSCYSRKQAGAASGEPNKWDPGCGLGALDYKRLLAASWGP
jgi:hypothetical protein